MNAKTCKKFRKLARLIAGNDKQETTYEIMQLPLTTARAKARWANKGWAPMVWVSPACARGIYHQMKRSG
jgi:hypothetical protein